MKSKILFPLVLAFSLGPVALLAEEVGSGHYMPGASASFIDVLPGREALIYVNSFTYYSGSTSASSDLKMGAQIVANVDATVFAETSTLVYETPWELFGAKYGAAMSIPYVWMEVNGQVQASAHATTAGITRRDTANGLGDVLVVPVMLEWFMGDVKFGTTLGVYAPTGEYDKSQLANIGKNYWTFEPGVNVSWLSSKTGTEFTVFAGYDTSTKNNATGYQSGDVMHFDSTLAQHLHLLGGLVGVGANAFYYDQISRDKGDGANLGGFEGRTYGVGPVLSYATKLGSKKKTDLVIEAKWLPEMAVANRLKGDIVWVKAVLAF